MGRSNKEWENLGLKIFNAAKNELYLSMRYLYPALDGLTIVPDLRVDFLATDGGKLYFVPMLSAEKYMENPLLINRAYLHSVLHCLFGHMYRREGRDEDIWNLAADIMVEGIIDEMGVASVEMVVPPLKEEATARIARECKIFLAEYIYDYLKKNKEDILALENFYKVDDHSLWTGKNNDENKTDKDKKEENAREEELWKDVSTKIQTEIETYSRSIGIENTKLYQSLVTKNREKVSYTDFLRKFKEPVEEIKLDFETFDYGFYNYGLRLYGNMPLIEEPEYRVSEAVKNFVVVIDTSGSVSREIVTGFLEETVNILTEESTGEDFGITKQCVIIQCDNQIQDVKVLKSKDELELYIREFEIIGRGGTDFRVAFSYIAEEVKAERMSKPSGLIYFTDGYGTYPEMKPEYDVVFVFPETAYPDGKLPYLSTEFPVWAMHLVVNV